MYECESQKLTIQIFEISLYKSVKIGIYIVTITLVEIFGYNYKIITKFLWLFEKGNEKAINLPRNHKHCNSYQILGKKLRNCHDNKHG